MGLETFENGNVYRGEFHHGLREGFGLLIVNAKGTSDHNNIRSNTGPAMYAGEFRDGRLNGHGVWITNTTSGGGYSGTFVGNVPQFDAVQKNCRGPETSCVEKLSYWEGNVYYGEFMYGREEGIGVLEIRETGTSDEENIRTPVPGIYVGEFKGGRLSGRGMIFMPGAGFYGVFIDNKLTWDLNDLKEYQR